MIEWIGVAAGTLTTVSFMPQVWRTWKTRSAEDVSVWMLLAFNGGVALWLTYGLLLGKPSIVAANAITLPLSLALLTMKLRFTRRDGRQDLD